VPLQTIFKQSVDPIVMDDVVDEDPKGCIIDESVLTIIE
jgi:hypothetical protein